MNYVKVKGREWGINCYALTRLKAREKQKSAVMSCQNGLCLSKIWLNITCIISVICLRRGEGGLKIMVPCRVIYIKQVDKLLLRDHL